MGELTAAEREGRTKQGQPGVVDADAAEDPHRVEVETTSTPVFAENLNRKGATLVNDSAATIYLGIGRAAALHTGICLAPGGSWDGRIGELTWLGEVNAIATNAKSNLCVVEV